MCLNIQLPITMKLNRNEIPIKNNNVLPVDIPHLCFLNATGLRSHHQSFSKVYVFIHFSTRPHEADTVALSNLSTLESVFIENDTSFSSFSCGRDMKTQQNYRNLFYLFRDKSQLIKSFT